MSLAVVVLKHSIEYTLFFSQSTTTKIILCLNLSFENNLKSINIYCQGCSGIGNSCNKLENKSQETRAL
jgi:hypothetical protein